MISVGELYYLNRALDGKDIYGINLEFDDELSIFGGKKAKQKLIKEKILDEDGSINNLSYHILKHLEEYKKSSCYIWVNDLAMSVDKSPFLIYFKKKSDGRLLFKKTIKEIMIFNIMKQYEFLLEDNEDEQSIVEITMEEFLQEKVLVKDSKDILYLGKEENGETISSNAYYKEGDKVFKYDFIKEQLETTNRKDIIEGFFDLFRVEVALEDGK